MTMSVWATSKESLSHHSENGGNLPAGRFPAGRFWVVERRIGPLSGLDVDVFLAGLLGLGRFGGRFEVGFGLVPNGVEPSGRATSYLWVVLF